MRANAVLNVRKINNLLKQKYCNDGINAIEAFRPMILVLFSDRTFKPLKVQ